MHPPQWFAPSRCLFTFLLIPGTAGHVKEGNRRAAEQLALLGWCSVTWGFLDENEPLMGAQHRSEETAWEEHHGALRTESQGGYNGQNPSVESWGVKEYRVLGAGRWECQKGWVLWDTVLKGAFLAVGSPTALTSQSTQFLWEVGRVGFLFIPLLFSSAFMTLFSLHCPPTPNFEVYFCNIKSVV